MREAASSESSAHQVSVSPLFKVESLLEGAAVE